MTKPQSQLLLNKQLIGKKRLIFYTTNDKFKFNNLPIICTKLLFIFLLV